jgi:hypothetical protein
LRRHRKNVFPGKPSSQLEFEEAFFCYPGYDLVDHDKCHKAPKKTKRHMMSENISSKR